MRVRTFGLVSLLAMAVGAPLLAGDLATFVNLGFSADGSRFMFGQYGVSEPGTTPYATVAIVDVPGNRFVSGGVKTLAGERPVNAGDPGDGALHTLLREAREVVESNRIDHLRRGRGHSGGDRRSCSGWSDLSQAGEGAGGYLPARSGDHPRLPLVGVRYVFSDSRLSERKQGGDPPVAGRRASSNRAAFGRP